jgi:hypothetical protein
MANWNGDGVSTQIMKIPAILVKGIYFSAMIESCQQL